MQRWRQHQPSSMRSIATGERASAAPPLPPCDMHAAHPLLEGHLLGVLLVDALLFVVVHVGHGAVVTGCGAGGRACMGLAGSALQRDDRGRREEAGTPPKRTQHSSALAQAPAQLSILHTHLCIFSNRSSPSSSSSPTPSSSSVMSWLAAGAASGLSSGTGTKSSSCANSSSSSALRLSWEACVGVWYDHERSIKVVLLSTGGVCWLKRESKSRRERAKSSRIQMQRTIAAARLCSVLMRNYGTPTRPHWWT